MFPVEVIEDLAHRATHAIRAGYGTPEQIFYDLFDLIEDDPQTSAAVDGERDEAASELWAIVDSIVVAVEDEQEGWPEVTDCDQITAAFARLRGRGVLAVENDGASAGDLRDDMLDRVLDLRQGGRHIRGWCGFSSQEVDQAMEYGVLAVAFAPVDVSEEQDWKKLGEIIVEELHRGRLEVRWDGPEHHTVEVHGLRWQRRPRHP